MVTVGENQKTKNGVSSLKFLYSYGGRILPRSIDRKLRYVGGFTRVLSVNYSISFAEVMVKLEEFCGYSVDLKCQLPDGDLETLISVKSDENLTNVVEEYARVYGGKNRAILSPQSSRELSPKSPAYIMFIQPRYCLASAENLPGRFCMSSGEYSNCCNCRVHRDSNLIWH